MIDDESRTLEYNEKALKLSEFYKGKVGIVPKVPVRSLDDFSVWYTPGVAAVARKIAENIDLSFELTGRWNSVAILTDGTRVLGLGNIGPEAAMPVMEGKSLIFNYLGGVNAVPIPVRAASEDDFIKVAMALEPSFGGFNLEDIESPKCFSILEKLQKTLEIPAWHDDQLGTASITLAGVINALRVVNKKIDDVRVVFNGAGAANIAAAYLFNEAGFKMKNMVMIDSSGILEPERPDMDRLMLNNPLKYKLAIDTNEDRLKGNLMDAVNGADIIISASKSQPGIIKPEHIKLMNRDPIVFALANPLPEIWPRDAINAGARIVATGRSDFNNQINNSLVFPGVFRGILDARARKVNFKVMVSASYEIANAVKNPDENHIVPDMSNWELYPRVAAAVASKCSELGFARKAGDYNTFLKRATDIIEENRRLYDTLIEKNIIKIAMR
ncbi:NAD(P)-dependent malic enzyme [Picrophilus oshimae]|uniref:Malate dehydrogenase (Oxaloacetate-decarboxylating) n=1 Tax=Picrophilus torridus (strain ATCC 700027 / DSM 9790 / JCM 10055 / NBRC 100828 / KAW 2/3) TaxID=1122961 RepID=A0A8G2FVC6_PICTO|nr:NADP-dependent malic enzyme [Picrophilus oshimae]SMD30146.1 malate dehydrogenase (oxaloacetate-decarboxylating) [Picrophilus oshimae DSM 9789]